MVAGSSRIARGAVSLIVGALILSAGVVLDQPVALAGNPFGGFVGGVLNGVVPYRYRAPAAPRRYNNGSPPQAAPQSAETPSPADSTRALASLAPPPTQQQQAILKSIVANQSLGMLGEWDDLAQIGKADQEAERDYTGMVERLIEDIKRRQTSGNAAKEGDITEHAILESLDASIHEANLQKFETFLGENWSPERLRVMILERVNNEIGTLFEGTNHGAVTMSDLDQMIKKAGRNVYSRLFETSELLASNRGSTLFVQRLYQTHGDLVNGDVRESAEQLLAQASASGVAPLEPLLRRDPNAFALRYRAQRIIYDCLSDNVEAISSSESGMATAAEIAKRVADVGQQQCSKWVDAQLKGPDGKLKPQDPVPLRVIWTAEGPKDDASMYGRASDQL
ncbi:MAG: hypothetical protein ACLPSW_09580 [Roseiarcus sp.]